VAKYSNIALICLVGVTIGLAIYEIQQADHVRAEIQHLRSQQPPLTEQIGTLRTSLANLTNQLAIFLSENAQLKTNSSQIELLKLRSEATRLRPLQDDVATLRQMVKQSSAGPIEWKTNGLADAGCANPADALKTYFYSSQSDRAKLQNGVVGDDADPPSETAIQNFIKGKENPLGMRGAPWKLEGYKILSQSLLSPGKAQLILEVEVHGGIGFVEVLNLRKINGEWKLVVFNVRDRQGDVRAVDFWHE
jgi:hypothetical protein